MTSPTCLPLHWGETYHGYVRYSDETCELWYKLHNISSVYHAKVESPIVGLTFDDGPDARLTVEKADILDRLDAKGTFFLLGENVKKYPDLARELVRRGHEVGNHTFTHPKLTDLPYARIYEELRKAKETLQEITNAPFNKMMRPPYGLFNSTVMKVAHDLEYHWNVLWDVDSNDSKGVVPRHTILDHAMRGVGKGAIVLMHDWQEGTVEALPEIIRRIHGMGYRMPIMSEILQEHEAARLKGEAP